MTSRTLPAALPGVVGWVVPGVVTVAVISGFLSTIERAVPDPGNFGALSVAAAVVAVAVGALPGTLLLVPRAPVAAAWLSVAAGAAVVAPADLPSWVFLGVAVGAAGALALQVRATKLRRTLASLPRHAAPGPPADVAALLLGPPRRDLRALGLLLAGVGLTFVGLTWTASDVEQVFAHRAWLAGLVDHSTVTKEGWPPKTTVIADEDDDGYGYESIHDEPIYAGPPLGEGPLDKRTRAPWTPAPHPGLLEVMRENLGATRALVWVTTGLCALAAAHRRRRFVTRRIAAAASSAEAIRFTGRVQADEVGILASTDLVVGRLVHLPRLWPYTDDDDTAGPDLVGRSSTCEVDLVVLDDSALDLPVLARVGNVWMLATLTGPARGAAQPSSRSV